jgi:hypothetical protein
MANLARLFALLLALVATGILPSAAAPERVCSPGIGAEDASPCSDCSPECALCLCCPLRAAPTRVSGVPAVEHAFAERFVPRPQRPAPRPEGASVFHPPRA